MTDDATNSDPAVDRPSRTGICVGMRAAFERITAAAEEKRTVVGIPTWYDRLDQLTGGLDPGDLSVVAARPGMGKTAFATCVATNVASPWPGPDEPSASEESPGRRLGEGVLIFSPGTPADQLSLRMVCQEGRVDLSRVRQARLEREDWKRITEAASYISTLPLFIDDTPSPTVAGMTAAVRAHQESLRGWKDSAGRSLSLGLVIVDYLQLCEPEARRQNREEELSEVSRGLKAMARTCGVHVMALSQLNRAVETRQDGRRRPQLWDLRGSGSIEDDADLLLLIYRDEYYYPETTDQPNLAEIEVAKQRNGPRGKALLRFTPSYARFDNLAPGELQDELDD